MEGIEDGIILRPRMGRSEAIQAVRILPHLGEEGFPEAGLLKGADLLIGDFVATRLEGWGFLFEEAFFVEGV